MYPARSYRPFALTLLLGAVACTIRVIQPAPAAVPGPRDPAGPRRSARGRRPQA